MGVPFGGICSTLTKQYPDPPTTTHVHAFKAKLRLSIGPKIAVGAGSTNILPKLV